MTWRTLLIVAGFVAGAVWLATWSCEQRKQGGLAQHVAMLEADSTRLASQGDSVRKVYVHDTITLSVIKTRYTRLHDTLNIHDTVQVERFVTVADSAVHACTTALTTCEQGWSLEKQSRLNAEARASAYQKQIPGATHDILRAVLWGVVGFTAARVIK